MGVEINNSANVRLSSAQDIKLTKPGMELYAGQILKTVVIGASTNDEVMIDINGQSLTAKSTHHFTPGDLLEVKVVSNDDDLVLEIQHQITSKAILQSALLEVFPKQGPATGLLQTMSQITNLTNIPESIYLQIKAIMGSITSLSQLSQQLAQAISQSGIFLESSLFELHKMESQRRIPNDFKGQCLALLESLSANMKNSPANRAVTSANKYAAQIPLPLPGAFPQPLLKGEILNLLDMSSENILSILYEQLSQTLSRITTNQINHLSHDNKEGYLLMLDLPVRTPEGVEVIPLMIKQHNAQPMHTSHWSISFAVNLSNLGQIQGTIALSGAVVDVKFNTQLGTTLETLDKYQNEMSQVLKDLGLKLGGWKLQLGLEKDNIDVENFHLLDIRI